MGNCRSPEEGAPGPRMTDSQPSALCSSAQLLPSGSGDPRPLLRESLPSWTLIPAPRELPGLRGDTVIAFSESTEAIGFVQHTWENVLQKATVDPTAQLITFSHKGNWKLF